MNRIKAIVTFAVLVVVWPFCAVVWLVEWPLVKYMSLAPKPPARPAVF